MTENTSEGEARETRYVPKSAADMLRPTPAPQPPKRSRRARSPIVIFFNFLFSLLFLAVLGAAALLYWGRAEFYGTGPLKQQATYLVPRNSSLSAIADGLERQGIIDDAHVFEYGVRMTGSAADLKAGEYAFAPGISMNGIMEKLKSGESILHAVTIPEGWTVQQIYDRVKSDDALVGDMPPLAPEGTLLPETYKFTRGMSRKELIDKMAAADKKVVNEIWERRKPNLPIKDIGQFITLASIVEKETGNADERPHVASVFINRLKKGMRLQSDPTFLYGVYGGAGKPKDQAVTQADKDSDSPYNTYKIQGLPPGPIANPGRAALEAVANPSSTDDLYFVADGSGGHVFAKSLAEHNANVRRYRDLQDQASDDAAPKTPAADARSPAVAGQ